MKRLTKAEEEIMQMFWDHGASTVSGLIERMGTPKPPHSSISSIVRILEVKEDDISIDDLRELTDKLEE